jgi:large subunit ribosomal protein L28
VGMQCALCGKKTARGNKIARRGKAKYLGGFGLKITGITRRTFKPNLHRIKVVVDGKVRKLRVCTQCLRSGRAQRPIKQPAFQLPSE